ncbi:MAG: hypothetical protein PHV43_01235 [Candidatus Colwellbacteria bacterium]|nr:hypothetical protein [Candidatus Colwellbacteria bacterium]
MTARTMPNPIKPYPNNWFSPEHIPAITKMNAKVVSLESGSRGFFLVKNTIAPIIRRIIMAIEIYICEVSILLSVLWDKVGEPDEPY